MRVGKALLPVLLVTAASWTAAAQAPAGKPAAAAALKRDSARCRASADIDACYDAVRWNPNDPLLLMALGDALARGRQPEGALRNYRRAAAVAPATRELAAKISATEAKIASAHVRGKGSADRSAEAPKRYSNAAPETQSH